MNWPPGQFSKGGRLALLEMDLSSTLFSDDFLLRDNEDRMVCAWAEMKLICEDYNLSVVDDIAQRLTIFWSILKIEGRIVKVTE